jgi:hypothetical protein
MRKGTVYIMNNELDSTNLEHEIVHHPKKAHFIDTDLFVVVVLMISVVIGITVGIILALN